jgi:hypothetical protein
MATNEGGGIFGEWTGRKEIGDRFTGFMAQKFANSYTEFDIELASAVALAANAAAIVALTVTYIV